jgi:sodium/proline symporter
MLLLASYAAYATYLCIICTIGFIAYRTNKRAGHDFILGARSSNYLITALATHASDMSAWLFMAMPALVYTRGLVGAWTAIGLTGFMLANWLAVAPKLRTLTEFHGSNTISSFFAKRFNDTTGWIRLLSTVCALIFLTCYIAAGQAALGHLFESVLGASYLTGITVGSLIIFIVLFGGYTSIAWIDCFQGGFLLGAILLVPAVALYALGGWHNVYQAASSKMVFNFMPTSWQGALECFYLAAGWGLGYFGQPHIITKFMGIDNAKNIKKAQYVGISWQTIVMTAAVLIGLIGIAFFPTGIENPEFVFIEMTKALFHPFITGLVLCSIIASSINAMGAQVLALASVITEDVIKPLFNTKNKFGTSLGRLSVLALCFVAFIVAYGNQHSSIYGLVFYAWGGLGCSFGPLVLVALHTKMRSIPAALTGMLLGACVGGLWPWIDASLGTGIPAMIIGFPLSLFAMWLVSWGSCTSSRK